MFDIARELIRRGADVSRTTIHSPFEMAIYHACVDAGGSLEMADLLLDLGGQFKQW
jgi:hypothetical protein